MAPRKGGSGIVEGLWAGTAVFAATKSRTFSSFITSFILYAIVLMIFLAILSWVLKTIGLRPLEKFSVDEIQCQAGETPTNDCYGERGCVKPSGNCYKLLTTQTGTTSA